MKKILIILLCTLLLSSCSNNEEENKDERLKPINEIRESLDATIETVLNKEYENLVINRLETKFPEISEYYNLNLKSEFNTMNHEEFYYYFIDTIKTIFPLHPFAEENIYFGCEEYPFEPARVLDHIEDFFAGKFNYWWIVYWSDAIKPTGNDVMLLASNPTFSGYMIRGKEAELTKLKIGNNLVNSWTIWEDFVIEKYSSSSLPDRSYPLHDGDYSVKQAYEYSSEFFKTCFPIKYNSDISIIVKTIEPAINNNIYGYVIGTSTAYKGILFDSFYKSGSNTSMSDGKKYSMPLGHALMVEKDIIDYWYIMQPWTSIENEGKAVRDIIPFDTAFDVLSESLTKGVEFEVIDYDFVYCPFEVDFEGNSTATAAWKFITFNTQDEKYYIAYVEAQTGAFRYYSVW
ncbi:MAG: hypothetical protein FWG70_12155 [Oscillospiraceae bacterium]|nr:hypothetical protein [Oscillospiraceae bacterium]